MPPAIAALLLVAAIFQMWNFFLFSSYPNSKRPEKLKKNVCYVSQNRVFLSILTNLDSLMEHCHFYFLDLRQLERHHQLQNLC
jgi:hypothetical protein